MKKRIGSIILSLALIICVVSTFMTGGSASGNALNSFPGGVVALAATNDNPTFTDVPSDAWYADAVAYCQQNGLMTGTSETTFSPNADLSRAMVVTILHRAAGTPTMTGTSNFSDVVSGAWYSDAVTWASQNNIVSGYGNNLFGTNDPITREQLITILWRYDGSGSPTASASFTDLGNISSWASEAVSWGSEHGIVNVKAGNRFDPKSNALRAEAAYMLAQYLSPSSDSESTVYMTTDISSEGLMAIYEALGFEATGRVAIKLSTGEPPNSNYLRPELIKELVQSLNGTIVECNTAYGGSRSSTAMHLQVAKDHGFTDIADVDIQDANGYMSIPVVGGTQLTENFVGASFADYDTYVVLSHFKGHAMAGFGGAIKNTSIGTGSKEGKSWIHSSGNSMTSPWGGAQDPFLESMAEASKSVYDYLGNGQRIVYINVMNRLSVDCDCNGNPAEPDMHDVGILASFDPVALDKACIDLVAADPDGKSLMERINSRNGTHTLDHAAEIGLGNLEYNLESIDN